MLIGTIIKILIASGSPLEKRYASTIYPLRKRGNLLLCTLLLGNVTVNASIAIVSADFTSGKG
jgi:metal transporter CNNM